MRKFFFHAVHMIYVNLLTAILNPIWCPITTPSPSPKNRTGWISYLCFIKQLLVHLKSHSAQAFTYCQSWYTLFPFNLQNATLFPFNLQNALLMQEAQSSKCMWSVSSEQIPTWVFFFYIFPNRFTTFFCELSSTWSSPTRLSMRALVFVASRLASSSTFHWENMFPLFMCWLGCFRSGAFSSILLQFPFFGYIFLFLLR